MGACNGKLPGKGRGGIREGPTDWPTGVPTFLVPHPGWLVMLGETTNSNGVFNVKDDEGKIRNQLKVVSEPYSAGGLSTRLFLPDGSDLLRFYYSHEEGVIDGRSIYAEDADRAIGKPVQKDKTWTVGSCPVEWSSRDKAVLGAALVESGTPDDNGKRVFDLRLDRCRGADISGSPHHFKVKKRGGVVAPANPTTEEPDMPSKGPNLMVPCGNGGENGIIKALKVGGCGTMLPPTVSTSLSEGPGTTPPEHGTDDTSSEQLADGKGSYVVLRYLHMKDQMMPHDFIDATWAVSRMYTENEAGHPDECVAEMRHVSKDFQMAPFELYADPRLGADIGLDLVVFLLAMANEVGTFIADPAGTPTSM